MNVCHDIIIGVVSSFVASLFLGVMSLCVNIRARDRVDACLSAIQQYGWIIRNKYTYINDYDEIVHSAEEILKLVREIDSSIKVFNRFRRGKLFFTILYDIQCICERICFQTVGYDGEKELEARIKRIEDQQTITTSDGAEEFVICMEVEHLIKKVSSHELPFPIDINSFKSGNHNHPIQKYGLTKEEFDRKYTCYEYSVEMDR